MTPVSSYRRVRMLWPDHLGLARGKYLPTRRAEAGSGFCVTTFGLTYDRDIIPAPGAHMLDGLRDVHGTVDPDSLHPSWDDDRTAVLRVRPGRCAGLRLRAFAAEPGAAPGEWDRVTLRIREISWLAEELASYGPDVAAVEPADLRDAVVRLLEGAADAQRVQLPDTSSEVVGS